MVGIILYPEYELLTNSAEATYIFSLVMSHRAQYKKHLIYHVTKKLDEPSPNNFPAPASIFVSEMAHPNQ